MYYISRNILFKIYLNIYVFYQTKMMYEWDDLKWIFEYNNSLKLMFILDVHVFTKIGLK